MRLSSSATDSHAYSDLLNLFARTRSEVTVTGCKSGTPMHQFGIRLAREYLIFQVTPAVAAKRGARSLHGDVAVADCGAGTRAAGPGIPFRGARSGLFPAPWCAPQHYGAVAGIVFRRRNVAASSTWRFFGAKPPRPPPPLPPPAGPMREPRVYRAAAVRRQSRSVFA
jgi:hypothetical protein